jgi:aspartate-semialdehyde dehydrogenase
MTRKYNIAILGATGAVGEALLNILYERKFPIGQLFPLASSRSAGQTVVFGNKSLLVQDVAKFDFTQAEIALFSAGAKVSAQYAPIAANAGCIVIDNTSQFRYEIDVPLVVPEVNPDALENYRERNIIANPNCSTIQLVVALKPIYDAVGIERINIATYQAVSGSGRKGINELASQTGELLNGRPADINIYSQQIAFNVLPHCDEFQDNGYTKEEMKMVWETQKILEDDSILINPTAVRVPVFYGHSEAIHIETRKKLSADDARELLKQAPGIIVVDEPNKCAYPTAFSDASGRDEVFVGRIREDISHPMGLNLWVVADNVRKGAALNAVQIAELMIKRQFL